MGSYVEQLPAEYLQPDVFDLLSLDAQIYFRCTVCNREWRLNQTVSISSPRPYADRPCPDEDGGTLRVVVHGVRQEAVCIDCGNNWRAFTTLQGPVRCTRCGSTRYFPFSTRIDPFPAQFGNLNLFDDSARDHVWGVDPRADMQVVHEELQWIGMLPDAAQYLVPAALFVDRLRVWGEYRSADVWMLGNSKGVLLNEYYKRTSELHAGLDALRAVQDVVDAPATTVERAMVQHNVAMFAYSLVARHQPELQLVGGAEDFRRVGVRAAHRALELYFAEEESAEIRIQIARVRHVLGDLLKAGDATPEQLEEAVHLLDLAATEPALPEQLRLAARDSRAIALLRRDSGRDSQQSHDDLIASLADPSLRVQDRFRSLATLAHLAEDRGDLDAAVGHLETAAALAEQEVLLADDEASLGQAAEQFRYAFDNLARMRVASGDPRAALEAVETVRAVTVRFAHESGEDTARRARTRLRWQLNRFAGKPGTPTRCTERRLVTRVARRLPGRVGHAVMAWAQPPRPTERVDSALDRLLTAHWPNDAALCALFASGGYFSVVMARPDAGGGWLFDARQWPVSKAHLNQTVEGLNLEPGVFRERRLTRSCAAAGELVLRHVVPLLREWGTRAVAISAPGMLSHLSYEAVSVDGRVLGEEFDVCYVPSVSLGADLASRRTTDPPSRMLAVLYGGADLPHVAQEVEQLQHLWGSGVEVLDGALCTKLDVLRALEGDYDIVHVACHGTFELLDPLQSALYLDQDHDRDSKRVTARDLLGRTLPRSPVVTLSACSSGLTSYGLTNDCTGLTGSLLRAGARAVIGSRWAVYDDVAAQFMGRFYAAVKDGAGPQQALTGVQGAHRADSDIEDWAAFSYLGVP